MPNSVNNHCIQNVSFSLLEIEVFLKLERSCACRMPTSQSRFKEISQWFHTLCLGREKGEENAGYRKGDDCMIIVKGFYSISGKIYASLRTHCKKDEKLFDALIQGQYSKFKLYCEL